MPGDAGTLACRSQEPFVKKQAIGGGLLSRFRSSGRRALAANRTELAMKQQIAEKRPKPIHA